VSVQAQAAGEAHSLQRLRSLLLAEGGLMASLVGELADAAERPPQLPRAEGPAQLAAAQGPAQLACAEEGPAQPAGAEEGPAQLAAAGPRAEGRRAEYELLVEAIYEGYLLHYYTPRVVLAPGDDLGVLAGDRLYALGLDRLVKLGDMHAVAELADVITLTALAHGDGQERLAHAVWRAGAWAVGWGPSAEHERAKALMRAGAPEALAELERLVRD
jgi:hypothetical protein